MALGGLLLESGGKFRPRRQSDSNFVRPVWLARVLGNFKSKLLEEEVSVRVNFEEEGEGKREEGAAKSINGFPPIRFRGNLIGEVSVGVESQVHSM